MNKTAKLKKHIFFWIPFWILQSLLMSQGKLILIYLIKNIPIVVIQAIIVYFNILILFPRFFKKNMYILYFFVSGSLIYFLYTISFFFIKKILSIINVNVSFLEVKFRFDFWEILGGASFYYLAFLISTLYLLSKENVFGLKKKKDLEYAKSQIKIKDGKKMYNLQLDSILFIKGMNEYVQWVTPYKKYVSLDTLKRIEEQYREENFIRVHKSYIVNLNLIISKDSKFLYFDNNLSIPIGRSYKKKLDDFY